MEKQNFINIVGSAVIIAGMVATMVACGIIMVDPTKDPAYIMGVENTHKEAFEKGYMEKVITQDDKVIYKWKDSK